MIALACAGHVLVDLPLFGAPVLFVVGAVLLIRRSERRRYGEGETTAGSGPAAAPAASGQLAPAP